MTTAQQSGFVIYAPIQPASKETVDVVKSRIEALGNPAGEVMREALDATGCVHFMSMSVIWDEESSDPPILLLEVEGDGDQAIILNALVEFTGETLVPLFEIACGVQSRADLEACLRRHAVTARPNPFPWPHKVIGLPFQGTPGLTARRIREDSNIEAIAREVVEKLACSREGRELPALAYLAHARESLARVRARFGQPPLAAPPIARVHNLKWADPKESSLSQGLMTFKRSCRQGWPPLVAIAVLFVALFLMIFRWDYDWRVEPVGWPILLSLILAALAVLTLLSILATLFAVWLRAHEKAVKPRDIDPDPSTISEIMRREDRCAQNHMTAVSTLTSNFFRTRVSLVFAMLAVERLIKTVVFEPGFLASIGTIHFAQWVRLPGTRKLVFLSNYDGSWQSYLEDFITKARAGLTGVWSNTADFPKTKWLFQKGAADGHRFKRWARRQQIPTGFWYSAYPDLTALQIRNNVKIRQGLESATTLSDAEAWLALFGSAERPDYEIQTEQIQGLVLYGQRNLLESACLLFKLPEDRASGRAWLSDVSTRIVFGQEKQAERAMFLALSAEGLDRLGLYDSHDGNGKGMISDFPAAFVLGMDSESRRRALGDADASEPEKWDWGGPGEHADAILLLYSKTPDGLLALRNEEMRKIDVHGLNLMREVALQRWPERGVIYEPFGFADGISQPAIRGLRASARADKNDLVEPGEFILGYKDGRDLFPPTPQVPRSRDRRNLLPNLPSHFPAHESQRREARDLGRNGCFLVVRQLAQDVEGFHRFTDEEADRLEKDMLARSKNPRPKTGEWVEAKMVGRWKNGAPLVAYPEAPPTHYDAINETSFLLGRDDPQGLACPFGAHIRRANPRDSFDPKDPDQIPLVNRHRILRRGRAYVEGGGSSAQPQGLLFMCLNADIERQFEFLQQTWISSPSFSGLRGEADPLVSTIAGERIFTIPQAFGPQRVQFPSSFVTVKGGGYFFLPSRAALRYIANL